MLSSWFLSKSFNTIFCYKRCNHKIMNHTQLLCALLKSNGIANQDDMIKLNGRIKKQIRIIFLQVNKRNYEL
jgi:hypothetical protein